MSKSKFTVDKEKLEVRIERVYDATPEQLFEAHTDPEQIPKWWGPKQYSTVIDKQDLKVGGAWRYLQTDQDGTVHAFSGMYKEIDEPDTIVRTFEYEPIPGHILVETVTFKAQPNVKTLLTSTAHYANIEDLEGMVSMGMEEGSVEGQERLAELVEKT